MNVSANIAAKLIPFHSALLVYLQIYTSSKHYSLPKGEIFLFKLSIIIPYFTKFCEQKKVFLRHKDLICAKWILCMFILFSEIFFNILKSQKVLNSQEVITILNTRWFLLQNDFCLIDILRTYIRKVQDFASMSLISLLPNLLLHYNPRGYKFDYQSLSGYNL